jgi:cytosine/uracil/thiamine/allantoin permease
MIEAKIRSFPSVWQILAAFAIGAAIVVVVMWLTGN